MNPDKKKNYSVPDDYFNTLDQNILDLTVLQNQANTRRIKMRRLRSIAAALILFAAGFVVWQADQATKETAENIDILMDEELYAALSFEETEEEETLNDLVNFLMELDAYE